MEGKHSYSSLCIFLQKHTNEYTNAFNSKHTVQSSVQWVVWLPKTACLDLTINKFVSQKQSVMLPHHDLVKSLTNDFFKSR